LEKLNEKLESIVDTFTKKLTAISEKFESKPIKETQEKLVKDVDKTRTDFELKNIVD
jgi:hypothetical protein